MATINELTVKAFNKELAEMLDAFAKKHGLSKGSQRIVYARDGSTMKMTVEFGDKCTVGDVNPKFYKNTARFGYRFGLDVKQIGADVTVARLGKVKFVGMSSATFAVVEAADKRLYKYDPALLSALLTAANAKF